jgi:hypothetical protein
VNVRNYTQLIAMLKANGTSYKLFDLEYCVDVEVDGSKGSKFAYRFNINGKCGEWQLGDSTEIREQYIRVLHTGSPE